MYTYTRTIIIIGTYTGHGTVKLLTTRKCIVLGRGKRCVLGRGKKRSRRLRRQRTVIGCLGICRGRGLYQFRVWFRRRAGRSCSRGNRTWTCSRDNLYNDIILNVQVKTVQDHIHLHFILSPSSLTSCIIRSRLALLTKDATKQQHRTSRKFIHTL